MESDLSRTRVGVYINLLNFLKLYDACLVRKIDEKALIEIEEFEIVSGLNSVSLVELTDSLELDDILSINNKVRTNVPYILTLVKDRDDALGLVIDSHFS